MTVRRTSFPVYDADNHLYEPEEAFARHLPDDLIRAVAAKGGVIGKIVLVP